MGPSLIPLVFFWSVVLIAVCGFVVFRRKKFDFLLNGAVLFLLFVSYQVTPFFSLINGDYDSLGSYYFFVATDYFPHVVLFGFLVSLSFAIGWMRAISKSTSYVSIKREKNVFSSRFETVSSLLALSLVAAFISLYLAGSFEGFLLADEERGGGQFNLDQVFFVKIYLSMLSSVIGLFVSVFSVGYLKKRGGTLGPVFFVILCLTLVSLGLFWKLSRASFLYFFIFFFVYIIRNRLTRRNMLAFIFVVAMGVFAGQKCLDARYVSPPGLVSFFDAMVSDYSENRKFYSNQQKSVNSMDASMAFTSIAYLDGYNPRGFYDRTVGILNQINPLPSFLLGKGVVESRYAISDAFDVDSVNVTVPLLADLYQWSWIGSILLFGILGRWGFHFERWVRLTDSSHASFIFVLVFCGVIVSSHQGVRAVTRFFLYGLVYYIIFFRFRRFGIKADFQEYKGGAK